MYANTSEVIWGCAYCSRKLSNQLNQLKEFYDQISHRSNCIYTKLQRSHRLEKQVGAEQQGRFHESNFKWFVYCTNELADVSEIKTEKCKIQKKQQLKDNSKIKLLMAMLSEFAVVQFLSVLLHFFLSCLFQTNWKKNCKTCKSHDVTPRGEF